MKKDNSLFLGLYIGISIWFVQYSTAALSWWWGVWTGMFFMLTLEDWIDELKRRRSEKK
jgi:hypothetical protein